MWRRKQSSSREWELGDTIRITITKCGLGANAIVTWRCVAIGTPSHWGDVGMGLIWFWYDFGMILYMGLAWCCYALHGFEQILIWLWDEVGTILCINSPGLLYLLHGVWMMLGWFWDDFDMVLCIILAWRCYALHGFCDILRRGTSTIALCTAWSSWCLAWAPARERADMLPPNRHSTWIEYPSLEIRRRLLASSVLEFPF